MKRSDRLVSLMHYFLENPREHTSLPVFGEQYKAAKSSISEDLDIIDRVMRAEGKGYLQTLPGASGGVRFIPELSEENSMAFIRQLCTMLEDPERMLPGGYLYMSDILGDPKMVNYLGRILATAFHDSAIDVVVTVATKGIPLAYATASVLNVPVVIVRRDPRVTEGSSVSINYVSGSSKKIQTMVLPKRSLQEHTNVCIIDDFMKAGGTINGMINLLDEFNANVSAVGVLAEAEDDEDERMVDHYKSLVNITEADGKHQRITAVPGNISPYS
ncbi:pur operon repressor [Lentibacillus halophilus]|uniref:Pur operon repressor n=1 Tax=Lentibacillus halophilus TaxID=295065 RepID=A0ABN0Z935_9BACI